MISPENSCPLPGGLVEPVNKYFHIPVKISEIACADSELSPSLIAYEDLDDGSK